MHRHRYTYTTEKVGTDNSVKGNAKYRYNEIANVFGIPKQIEQVIFEDWEAIAMLIEEKLQSKEVRWLTIIWP